MFGSKLKTWMENHIGRPKKKSQQEKSKIAQNGSRIILESSESLAQSDTGISSGSQQVLSSSATDNKEGYCTTTMESDRSGMTHCHTTISLPSPESAYSTGYSTDGASPGGTGPPEYYINIRTGKHYFPSPAPTPTSPQPNGGAAFSQFHSANQFVTNSSFLANESLLPPIPSYPSQFSVSSLRKDGSLTAVAAAATPSSSLQSRLPSSSSQLSNVSNGFSPAYNTLRRITTDGNEVKPGCLSTSVPSQFGFCGNAKSPSKKSQLNSLKLFLKSPKQDKGKGKGDVNKTPTFEEKKKVFSPVKNKKWYKQPFQKFGYRRTESCIENNIKNEIKKNSFADKNLYYLSQQESSSTASPRQRNRIKTNPWLPTEPMSSQNFQNLQMNFSPCLARNRSCTNTPLQTRKTSEIDDIQTRIEQMNMKYMESQDYLNSLEKVVNRHIGQKLYFELSDHSEEDITLNEMMGTYNESYVYEKETDILSDSDPTDCEDYVSDSEADNGGDEQDSHDDELDFIDNGSLVESDDNFVANTGKCTYHDIYKKNSFLYKSDRHHSRKDSDCRKSFRKDSDLCRRKSKEDKKKRPSRKSFKYDDEDLRKRSEKKPKIELNENMGGLNLRRVLLEKLLAGSNGSKSADATPTSVRRQKLMKELRETHIGNDNRKLILKEIDPAVKRNTLLLDVEADKKYNELIMEAENMYESLQNSPVIQNRKKISLENTKPKKIDADTVDIWKKTEEMCCPKYNVKEEMTPRKSPKNLGLKLTMEDSSKKLKRLDFEKDKKSSFKAKSSAHSPLDPLGPTFRNFTVFKPTNIDDEKLTSTSSSEDSEPNKAFKMKSPDAGDVVVVPESPVVPFAFQSVDLGKPLTSYCPQSEPVKRKIYSCSKTYDKLVKRFENTSKIFEDGGSGQTRHGSLIAKKRPETERPKSGGFRQVEKSQPSLKRPICKHQNGEYFFKRPNYSPLISPRRASMPADAGSPTFIQRRSFESEVFR